MNNPEQKKEEILGQKKEFTIIVNGREKLWLEKTISFEQVIILAFAIYDNNQSSAFTVTFSRGEDRKKEGSMVIGDSVNVKEKMIFNVSKTDKS